MGVILKLELKRAFKNWAFFLVAAFGCIMAALAFYKSRDYLLAKNWLDYMGGYGEPYFLQQNMPMDVAIQMWMPKFNYANKYFYNIIMIMPILSAIPYGVSFLTDANTGVINQFVIRCKKSHYYTAKLITAFVSGGTVAVIPFIFNLIICMMYLPWGTPFYYTALNAVSPDCVLAEVYYTYPALYVFLYLLYIFVIFGLINCICLTFVYIEDNLFAVMLAPFIIYYTSHILFKYATGSTAKSLLGAVNMMYLYNKNASAIVIQIMVLAVSALLFLRRIKKDAVY